MSTAPTASIPSSPLSPSPSPRRPLQTSPAVWITPVLLLLMVYALLGLTFTNQLSHGDLMQRCVLMNPNLARIWSVTNIEIGLSYFGVFAGMVYYFLRLYRQSRRHVIDLGLACAYVVLSFTLDLLCVRNFEPFVAMLIGDAIVMTFTLIVSRQLWFQRLLGVFVPIIFLTCSFGHFMEGLSYWHLTYPLNVPWMMVTADCGFAVLVNSSRFPGLIRGEDILGQLNAEQTRVAALEAEVAARVLAEEQLRESERQREMDSSQRSAFARNVMRAMTGGRLDLHAEPHELPQVLPDVVIDAAPLSRSTLSRLRRQVDAAAIELGFPDSRRHDLTSAAGEVMMNAIVHAQGGTVTLSRDESVSVIQVRAVDAGSGMDWESLPLATLQSGWSSKGTLGMGFTLMASADKVDILTGPQGTTIILTMAREERVNPHFALSQEAAFSVG